MQKFSAHKIEGFEFLKMKKKIIFNINIKYKMQCKWEYKMQDQRKSF